MNITELKRLYGSRSYLMNFALSIGLVLISLVINYFAGIYATNRESSPVTDLILSNVPLFDVDALFVYGAMIFWICTLVFLALNPKRVPFTLKSIALFTIIRAGFLTLTHIGPFPTREPIDPASMLNFFTFGGDLFFSGHVGLPFILTLIFWNNKTLRVIFLASTLLFAVVVLLGHYHYTIDVASAFFITYTIYHLARYFFKKDYALFISRTIN